MDGKISTLNFLFQMLPSEFNHQNPLLYLMYSFWEGLKALLHNPCGLQCPSKNWSSWAPAANIEASVVRVGGGTELSGNIKFIAFMSICLTFSNDF